MARYRDLLSSFLLGEVSPRVLGRAELDQYKQMCEEVTNMIVIPQGGAKRRPGTQFLSNNVTFSSETAAKTVPFVISKTESYVIIFTNNIYPTGHPVLADGEDRGITIYSVSDGTITYPHTLENPPSFSHIVNDGFPNFTDFTGYTTPTQLSEIQYAQFGNTIFFAQKDQPPFAIQKNAEGFWIFPFWTYQKLASFNNLTADDATTHSLLAISWPYTTRNLDTESTVAASATSGAAITLTAAKDIFNANQVGSAFRMTNAGGAKTGVAAITAYTDSKHVTAQVLVNFGDTSVSDNWALSSWSKDVGWPRSIAFFQNRIFYGGSENQPNSIWASYSGNVASMRQEHYIDDSPNTVTNADALEFSIAATELDQVQWMSAGKSLAIGTLGREYIAYGPDPSTSFGPLNFNFDAESAYGSKAVQAVRRDNALLFVQRSGRKIREFVFNFQEDSYKAQDIMIYAEHMSRRSEEFVDDNVLLPGEIVEMVHQEADDQLGWFRDSNKGLFSVTRNRDLNITAFHYHPIAGNQIGYANAVVIAICVCPSADGTHDDLYLLINRNINDVSSTYLERINREFERSTVYNTSSSILDKPVYVDSCKIHIAGSVALTHSGFTHLVGEPVQVVADGFYVGTFIVDNSGVITLKVAAKEVIAGLAYTSKIKPSSINMGSVIGTSQGAVKTIDQITFKFVRTIGAKFGIFSDDLYDINFRDPNAAQNDPIALFTGDKEISAPLGWDTSLSPLLIQELPFPMEVTAMICRGVLND